MSPTKRVLSILTLVVCVGCTVWNAWQLFTDTNRVVTTLTAVTVALAVARPAISNLAWGDLSAVLEAPQMDGFHL